MLTKMRSNRAQQGRYFSRNVDHEMMEFIGRYEIVLDEYLDKVDVVKEELFDVLSSLNDVKDAVENVSFNDEDYEDFKDDVENLARQMGNTLSSIPQSFNYGFSFDEIERLLYNLFDAEDESDSDDAVDDIRSELEELTEEIYEVASNLDSIVSDWLNTERIPGYSNNDWHRFLRFIDEEYINRTYLSSEAERVIGNVLDGEADKLHDVFYDMAKLVGYRT